MMGKRKLYKSILPALVLATLVFMAGCGKVGTDPQTGTPATGNQATATVQTPGSTTSDTTQKDTTTDNTGAKTPEEKLTEKLLKEPGVADGKVYIEKDMVVCTIAAKEDADTGKIKKLAQKYADELKKTYGDRKINVQAVQKGENIANIQ